MTLAIELQGLTKQYRDVKALDDVSLRVEYGSVFGFLGPNGAGKTTTLRILNGLARASGGRALVCGEVAGSVAARREVGFLPDVPGFYEWMTAPEFLRFAGGLHGIDGSVLDERVDLLLDMSGLTGVATRVGGYSRGMKQRLGVAQALINAPRVLMLDEPTSALDPIGRRDVLQMIHSLKGRTTVFFSTHILADVERVCDTVAILDRGRVAIEAPVDELKARFGSQRILVEVDGSHDALAAALAACPWVTAVEAAPSGGLAITVSDPQAAGTEIPALVSGNGLVLRRFEREEATLEDVFVDLLGTQAVGAS